MKAYYKILEVPPDASLDQIEKRYHFLISIWHPDNEAYKVLSTRLQAERAQAENRQRERADEERQRKTQAERKAKEKNSVIALMEAALVGHTDTVRVLLANGTDVNARNNNGVTALLFAVMNGHTDTVQALLANGAVAGTQLV